MSQNLELDRNRLALLADFAYFIEALGYQVKDFHRDVCEALQAHSRVIGLLPRDHGKTTLATVYATWRLWKNAQIRIRIASHTAKYAEDIQRGLLGILQSPRFLELCGDLKPRSPSKWAQSQIIIQGKRDLKDPSVATVSIGSRGTVGPHEDLLICDDIVSEDNSRSKALRTDLEIWFKKELLSTLDPKGQLLILGTRWYWDDLYNDLLKAPHLHIIKRAAIGAQNEVLWPERWPLERLLARKEEVGVIAFASQYQNDPTPLEGALNKAEWLHYWDETTEQLPKVKRLPPRESLRILQGWDLAISQSPEADYTVCVTIGVDASSFIYLLDIYRAKIDFPAQAAAVEAQALAWKPERIAIESQGYQAALSQSLRPTALPIIEVKQTKDKTARMLGLQPFFQNGALRIHKRQDEFISEFLRYPMGEHDDILDALELAFRQVQTGGVVTTFERKDWWTR